MSQTKLGVCYYPEQWPPALWASDAAGMRELGIGYVRIGEFAWSRIEPSSGRFDWAWLDTAVETLADAGLEIIFGTPTACPPHWLIKQYPEILPVGPDGRVRGFGSRRHYSFSSERYAAESARITEAVVRRYGKHPNIVGWQLDNEYGCHDTTLCYSDGALQAFRRWLARRYASIDALNQAWGNVFWSQEYARFDDVGLPLAVTETNPSHRLAFWRFSSEQVCAFNDAQASIIRKHCHESAFLTHNFMGNFVDFDHFKVMRTLDVASWDSYPLGFLDQAWFSEGDKQRYRRTGHPDWAAFHHDLYRAVGDGRFAVMEQQPGAVNWAAHNAEPLAGMVRLWSWEAIAHGAEFVSWFRWRQAPFAQEQMHAGLRRPDNQPAIASAEVQALSRELERLELPDVTPASVALVFDYAACWGIAVQPQQASYSTLATAMAWYSAARGLGLDVDIVAPGSSLEGYALVLLPCQPNVDAKLLEQLKASSAQMVFGPRAGSKTEELTISDQLAPGPLQAFINLQIISVDAVRDGVTIAVQGGDASRFVQRWVEHVQTELAPSLSTADGRGIVYRQQHCTYIGAELSPALLQDHLAASAHAGGLSTTVLPDAVRLRRRGSLTFAFNYSDAPQSVAPDGQFLVGAATLPSAGVSIWRHG